MSIPGRKISISIMFVFLWAGCSTTPRGNAARIQTREASSALRALAGSLSGKNLSEKETRELATKMNKDDQTRSAVRSLQTTMSGRHPTAKYCPIDGKHFSYRVEVCPEHNVPLKEVEE